MQSERTEHGWTFSFDGELDAATVADLNEQGLETPTDATVVIDLRKVTLLDSTGIGFLHVWFEQLEEAGHEMSIQIADPTLDELFRICGLTERLGVVRVD